MILLRLVLLPMMILAVAAVSVLWVGEVAIYLKAPEAFLRNFFSTLGLVGLGGSIISTLFSRPLLLRATRGRRVLTPVGERETLLLEGVAKLAKKVGIPVPEVAIFPGEPNAFCAGWGRGHAVVAVSGGLLQSLGRRETEAILAHEIVHIANGDMLTLELLQGVMNVFVVWPALLMDALSRALQPRDKSRPRIGTAYHVTYFICMVLFGFLAGLLLAWFSRWREYRADKAAMGLIKGSDHLSSALGRLGTLRLPGLHGMLTTAGVAGGRPRFELYATHPGFDLRIRAIKP